MRQRDFDDTREHLLATGEAIMLGRGFAAVGLAEILQRAGVPKGSFYHYFDSKEAFGAAMLARFFERYLAQLDALLANPALNGRAKLHAYLEGWQTCSASDSPRCLVVKLSGEVCDLSEAMRAELAHGTAAVVERLAACVVLGRADGSVPAGPPAEQVGRALYANWLGAALLAKMGPSGEPFQAAQLATDALIGPKPD